MKNCKLLVSFSLVFFLLSCEKETKLYDGVSNIYFPDAIEQAYANAPLFDSMEVVFAYAPGSNDSIQKVKVKISGSPAPHDRNFRVVVDPASTAIPGKHFEALPENMVIEAGRVVGHIPVKLKRTDDMQENVFTIILKLQPNEHFQTEMKDKIVNSLTGKKLHYTQFTLHVSDILTQPMSWFDGYVGPFSRKKINLISQLMDIPLIDFTDRTIVGISRMNFIGVFMQRYLNDERASNRTVYEEDGVTEMVMGPYVQ